ncbi:hypothetical protein [Ilumatobacter sp.]|uniref:hypothetical protein n=1 Tax=Ilumatobacter sp. TaxID=1967498 RepID=UPI003B521042
MVDLDASADAAVGSAQWRRTAAALAATAVVGSALVQLAIGERHLNPDAASYLAIARHWSDGEWSAAVNGYWSPLLSFVLAPVAAVGGPLVAGARALMVLTAGASVVALLHLLRTVGVRHPIATAVALGSVPFVMFAALDNITPDLGMAALLLAFTAGILDPRAHPVVTGVLGGAAFLAKAYALPFVLAFTFTMAAASWVATLRAGGDGRRVLARFATIGSVIAAIALAWSIAVSVDAGRPTFSTASEYSRRITAHGSLGDPYGWAGLIEPAEPTAFWGWEDPPGMLDSLDGVEGIDPGDELSDPDAQARRLRGSPTRFDRIIDNADATVRSAALVAGPAVAAPVVVAWAAWSSVRRGRRRRPSGVEADEGDEAVAPLAPEAVAADGPGAIVGREAVLGLAAAAAIYVGGLLALTVLPRYLFYALLVAVAVAAVGLEALRAHSRPIALVAVALVVVAGAVRPAVALGRLAEATESVEAVDELLTDVALDGARVASMPLMLTEVGSRCLEAGCVYLGQPRTDSDQTVAQQLRDHRVDLVVVRAPRVADLPAGSELVARSDDGSREVHDVSDLHR